METSTTLPRKYFVVVTHSTTSQRELESMLSSERFNSFEGVDSPSSAPMVMEFTYPNISRKMLRAVLNTILSGYWPHLSPNGAQRNRPIPSRMSRR